MAKYEKDLITSPSAFKREESCKPPKGTQVNGAVGYGVPERTHSKNAVEEVTYDHNSPEKKGDL
ncbi:MAG TPA: hypothetical protein VKQ11_00445 [Candidatus Sulfotelmatobacter sp.]|nr:hypothetical protein [Candidatus Sulfotelmatobacter sp.]